MAYKSLLQFVDVLEQAGELIRIKEFTDPVLEIAEVADRVSKLPGGGKALLFENTGTAFPLLINSLGSEYRISKALDTNDLNTLGEKIPKILNKLSFSNSNIWTKLKFLPTLKELSSLVPVQKKGKGACQEIVMPEPDLNRLPVLKCWPGDAGRFITLPLVNTVNPVTGIRNVGMYRLQVFSANTTGMHWHRHKTGAMHYEQYKSLGKLMPVAVALGGDPALTYAATAPLPDNIDEYLFAGFLRNKRVELVKCLTQDIFVPADADFIIEGYVEPNEPLVLEGPFGDHTGFYSLADDYPLFHVTCITHRKNAIYPATIVGIPPQEDSWISKATERLFLAPIRMAIAPEIIDINLPAEGISHNLAIVKIKKTYPGQAFKVMNALWGAGQMMFNKVLIVTGQETDIFSPIEVLKSMIINVTHPSHLCFQMGPSDVLDHSSRSYTYGGKLCIDSTVKMPEEIALQNSEEANPNNIIPGLQIDETMLRKFLENCSEIRGFNTSLLKEGIGLLILAVDKNRKGQVKELSLQFTQMPIFAGIRFIIFVDRGYSLNNISLITWLTFVNIDPVYDCYVLGGENNFFVIVDATKKNLEFDGFKRDWPSVIISDSDTIKQIDNKWASLGLGIFIKSPSLLLYE